MYKNKYGNLNNIAGRNVRKYRSQKNPVWSQRQLAEKLQLEGHDVDKNAVQRMEAGLRFITDIELKSLSKVLGVSVDQLLDDSIYSENPAVPYGEEKPDVNTQEVAENTIRNKDR